MTRSKPKRGKGRSSSDTSPAKMLGEELQSLQHDLRVTIKAYGQRLENDLHRTAELVRAESSVDDPSRERLHDFRDAMTLVQKRKLKPENGRRKDLRKIDSLIEDLRLFVRENATGGRSSAE